MHETLAITGPIYLVIALGFLAGRFGIFSKPDMRVLGAYVVKFALPALVFTALSQRSFTEVVDARYLFAYVAGSLVAMAIGFSWGRWVRRRDLPLSALFGLGTSNSNSGFIGYPIAVLVCGSGTGAVGLAMCMFVENLLIIPLTLAIAESANAGEGKWHRILGRSLLQLARNPVIIAIAAGIGVAMLNIPVSGAVAKTINMLAMSSTAVALFVIGGTLYGLELKGMRQDATTIALGKLVLHPLAVGTIVWLLPPADPTLRTAAVVFASVPMLSIYPIVAQKYGHDAFCAAALLLATIISFVSISVILWLLGPVLDWTAAR
jgi:predicted permease